MSRCHGFGSVVLVLSLASTSGLAQIRPAQAVAMPDLTVPQDRLAEGCALSSATPRRFVGQVEVAANPWIGTDPEVLQDLASSIIGLPMPHPPLPDAIFITPEQESALRAKAASGVVEGYAASYRQRWAKDLTVQAIRFAVAPDHRLGRGARNVVHLEIGPTWIQLSGDAGACSKAIEAHLKSLAN